MHTFPNGSVQRAARLMISLKWWRPMKHFVSLVSPLIEKKRRKKLLFKAFHKSRLELSVMYFIMQISECDCNWPQPCSNQQMKKWFVFHRLPLKILKCLSFQLRDIFLQFQDLIFQQFKPLVELCQSLIKEFYLFSSTLHLIKISIGKQRHFPVFPFARL